MFPNLRSTPSYLKNYIFKATNKNKRRNSELHKITTNMKEKKNF